MPRSSCRFESRARAAEALLAALLLAALGGCHCGANPALTTFYTDVVYSTDGSSLVLHADDGIYVAQPVGSTPQRVTDQNCSASKTKSLDCVRIAPNARRLAVLAEPRIVQAHTLWTLLDEREQGASAAAGFAESTLATDALDAALSQEGSQLVYSRVGDSDQVVNLYDVGASGQAIEIVHGQTLGGATPEQALSTITVTPYGIAFAQAGTSNLGVWFRPWASEAIQLGEVPSACAGMSFPVCVQASADGTALVWQDTLGGVIHAWRPQDQLDLPLGQGYGFAFSPAGSYLLRMDSGPYVADVQSLSTAVVARAVVPAISANLSTDGETIGYLTVESTTQQTWHLYVGDSRRTGQDRDLGVLSTPTGRPLISPSIGSAALGHGLTGDVRFEIVEQPPTPPGTGGALWAYDADTGETRQIDSFTCSGCCTIAPAGSLVICLPTMSQGSVTAPAPVDIYDPVTALKTHATDKAIIVQALFDGSGIAVLEYAGDVPEVFVATKDGQRVSHGNAVRVAAAPDKRQIAIVTELGQLSLDEIP